MLHRFPGLRELNSQPVGQISIVPINAMDAGVLERLALCLEERFLFTCTVERTLRIPHTTLNSVRKQMFLNTLMSRVGAVASPDDGLRLAITEFDLYKTSHQFIFGDANEEQRVAIVSLHRLRSDFYGERSDENVLFQRTLKESVHNLGHALGLKHCYNARCAMYFSNSIFDTDNKLSHFCDTCEKRIRASR
jgi:archaemetzincin